MSVMGLYIKGSTNPFEDCRTLIENFSYYVVGFDSTDYAWIFSPSFAESLADQLSHDLTDGSKIFVQPGNTIMGIKVYTIMDCLEDLTAILIPKRMNIEIHIPELSRRTDNE